MDDLGNIVYVLAVVGYMIYRVFAGKTAKPKPQGESRKQEGSTIEDILKQLTNQEDGKEVFETQPVSTRDEHEGHIHEAEPFLSVDAPPKPKREYRMSASEMVNHTRATLKKKTSKSDLKNHVDEVVDELAEGVDLRRAVIYQTILETPYLRHV